MSSTSRESRAYCAETCPAVDSVFSELREKLNEIIAPANAKELDELLDEYNEKAKVVGTYMLREALESCINDKQGVESEVESLKGEIRSLESQLDNLESQIKELEV